MGNVTTALIFVLVLDLLMCISVLNMAELYDIAGEKPTFCSQQGTFFVQNNIVNNSDISSLIPGTSQATSPTTGNIFTDVFTSIRNWILGIPGLNYVYIILSSPACAFTLMGLPPGISPLLIGFWYTLNVFLIIAFLWWRD